MSECLRLMEKEEIAYMKSTGITTNYTLINVKNNFGQKNMASQMIQQLSMGHQKKNHTRHAPAAYSPAVENACSANSVIASAMSAKLFQLCSWQRIGS